MISRFIEGQTPNNIIYVDAGLPNVSGSLVKGGQGEVIHSTVVASGAFYTQPTSNSTSAYGGSGGNANLFFDASRSSTIYGASTTVQPKSLRAPYIIKY